MLCWYTIKIYLLAHNNTYSYKKVSTSITKRKIVSNTILIKKFYKNKFKKNFKIAITQPRCESNFTNNEEKNIIKPAIKL